MGKSHNKLIFCWILLLSCFINYVFASELTPVIVFNQTLPGATPPIPAPLFVNLNKTNKSTDINDNNNATTGATGVFIQSLPGTTPPVSVLITPGGVSKPLPGTTPPVSVLTPPGVINKTLPGTTPPISVLSTSPPRQ